MADSYCYFRLRAPGNGWQDLAARLAAVTVPAWRDQGVHCWGVWQGLFGIASNELLVVAAASGEPESEAWQAALPGEATVVERLPLRATARPRTVGSLEPEGLYVFRFFDVRSADVDTVVELSRDAWETFEETERYAARPEGLFRPELDGDVARMLLVTWYDGFESWQTSRTPAPEARDYFRRRHELTLSTVALATRLVDR